MAPVGTKPQKKMSISIISISKSFLNEKYKPCNVFEYFFLCDLYCNFCIVKNAMCKVLMEEARIK
jgi:hypothetical protein